MKVIRKVPDLMEMFIPATRTLLNEKNHGKSKERAGRQAEGAVTIEEQEEQAYHHSTS